MIPIISSKVSSFILIIILLDRRKNLYEELGVTKRATTDEINKACNTLIEYFDNKDSEDFTPI